MGKSFTLLKGKILITPPWMSWFSWRSLMAASSSLTTKLKSFPLAAKSMKYLKLSSKEIRSRTRP